MFIEIAGKIVQFEDTKEYLDFFIDHGNPTLSTINFGDMLRAFASDPDNEGWLDFLVYLERWTREAPRKRFYRNLKLTGNAVVLSDECWFEHEQDGERIINNLENTGLFAKYLLDTFFPGWKPLYAHDGGVLSPTPPLES